MPAVKSLHQESACNAKAEFIMGHSCQTVSLLVRGKISCFAVPLVSRIHEGLVWSNRSTKTLLDKLVSMILDLNVTRLFYLVADGYYASKKVARPLLDANQHLIVRVRKNAVAFFHASQKRKRQRGRPRLYGRKLKLANQFHSMLSAPSPVYGERNITIAYRPLVLLWRPLGHDVQFVLVDHPSRGRIIILCTDLSLDPLKVIELYGLRFKIEVSFRQAVHTIGTYAYHFWMMDMEKSRRGTGDQYLHRKTEIYRQHIARKLRAYHRHIQLGVICQGLLQYISVAFPDRVWRSFGSWLRTMNPHLEPSELVVSTALRHAFPNFLLRCPKSHFFAKFVRDKLAPDRCPEFLLAHQQQAA